MQHTKVTQLQHKLSNNTFYYTFQNSDHLFCEKYWALCGVIFHHCYWQSDTRGPFHQHNVLQVNLLLNTNGKFKEPFKKPSYHQEHHFHELTFYSIHYSKSPIRSYINFKEQNGLRCFKDQWISPSTQTGCKWYEVEFMMGNCCLFYQKLQLYYLYFVVWHRGKVVLRQRCGVQEMHRHYGGHPWTRGSQPPIPPEVKEVQWTTNLHLHEGVYSTVGG